MQIIVFLNHNNKKTSLDTMHDNVKNALKAMKPESEYKPGEKSFWIPQFKVGDKKAQADMRSEETIKNFKIEHEQDKPPIYV